ncbi:MAG: hypothetical protein IJW59_00565 [Clostridia bacterium]|nr:hypothetical protein [Clostridia bacterium]
MELNKFINCLKFLHSKMSESITNYYINERINDWYEKDSNLYAVVKNDLGHISHALKESYLITFSKLFDEDFKESICVQNLMKIIQSCKIVKDDLTHKSLKEFATKVLLIIENTKTELNNLNTWRDKYLAHYDKKLRNNDALLKETKCNVELVLNLVENVYNLFNDILTSLGQEKISSSHNTFENSIDTLFFNFELGEKVLRQEGYEKLNSIISTINFPNS